MRSRTRAEGTGDSDGWDIGVIQKIDNINAEVFLMYRSQSLDGSLADFQDVSTIAVGGRWKF